MDSLTHIALGACVGEILLSKNLGKKALIWGIIAQNLPDIDSAAALFVPADQALMIHRGITHSLFFAIVIGLLLAFIAQKIHHKRYLPFALPAFFFCFQLTLHDLLDTCNSYGTGLLEPFSHQRFSVNLLYVADPLFTISMLIAALYLIFKNNAEVNRMRCAAAAIIISSFYLCFAGLNKRYIDKKEEASFSNQRIKISGYFSTPAPFNCMLWYIVAAGDSGYYTAYRSIWDNPGRDISYIQHPKCYSLLKKPVNKAVSNLITFAGDYYTLSQTGDTLFFNIPRFEQVQGWRNNNAPFAFSYPISTAGNQAMLLQRGRLAGWNVNSFKVYLERIAGIQTLNN